MKGLNYDLTAVLAKQIVGGGGDIPPEILSVWGGKKNTLNWWDKSDENSILKNNQQYGVVQKL